METHHIAWAVSESHRHASIASWLGHVWLLQVLNMTLSQLLFTDIESAEHRMHKPNAMIGQIDA